MLPIPSINTTMKSTTLPGILIRSICCLFLFVNNSYAQDITLPKQPIPKSPDVSSLLKFTENPVSVSTGLPEINIPLYTISSQFVNLPVSLSYHSGGVKVTDVAPWTGMGWSLVSGGVIAQNIGGMDDFSANPAGGRLNNPFTNLDNPAICELKNLVESKQDAQPDIFNFSFGGKSGQFFVKDDYTIGLVSESKLKIEALPGYVPGQGFSVSSWRVTDITGVKYEFNEYGTVENRTVSVMNGTVSNWEIELNLPVKSQRTYYLSKIIQPGGDEIVFQYDPYSIRNVDHTSDNKSGINASVSKNYQTSLIQEKRIRYITFPNGKLEFVPGPNRCDLYGDKMLDKVILYDGSNVKQKEFRMNYRYHIGSNVVEVNTLTFNPSDAPYFIGSTAAAIDNDAYKDKRLFLYGVDEIDVSTNSTAYSYQFEYNTTWGMPDRFSSQQDWWGYFNGNNQNSMLDGIFQDPASSGLSYEYTTPYRAPDLARTQAGILKKITYPTGGYAEFEYEQNTTAGNKTQTSPYIQHLPVSYNVSSGVANAYLGDLNINNNPNRTIQIKFEVQTCINGPLILNRPFSIRDAAGNTVYSDAQITAAPFESGPGSPSPYRTYTLSLTNGNYKIYSAITGGVPCSYYIKVLTWYEDAPIQWMSPAGGVRVKSSTLYDPVANKHLIKTYDYNRTIDGILQSSGKHTGGAPFKTGYAYNASDGLEWGNIDPNLPSGEKTKTIYILTSSPVYPLGNICYDKITEKRVDQSGNDLGKTEYTYLNYSDVFSSTYTIKNYQNLPVFNEMNVATPLFNVTDNSLMRNKLLKKEDFLNTGGTTYKSIVKQENLYNPVTLAEIPGLATTYHFRSAYTIGNTCSPYSVFLPQFDKIAYMKYTNSYAYLRLESTETLETTTDNTTLTRKQEYEYSEPTMLPKKITETNSTGNKIVSTYKYAGDYPNVTNSADGILNLQQKYAIGSVVEQSKYNIDPNNIERLTASSFISYLTGLPLPSVVYGMELTSPLTGFVPSSVQSGAITKDSRYVTKHLFNQYDTKGNILEQQKANDVKEAYLWGYNSQYPVAKVTGSDQNTVKSFINQSILDNPATTDAAMRTELNKIRTGLAGTNAQVFTYTYKPLTGVTSETDATGKVLFYEYDGLGRLKLIKDLNGKILKQYEYKYQAAL